MLAFALGLVLIPLFIEWIKKIYAAYGGVVRRYLEHHAQKKFTPSLGGTVIVGVLILISFLFLRPNTPYPYLAAWVLLSFALIGFVDDWLKITRKDGIRALTKLILQFLFAFSIAVLMYKFLPIDKKLYFPLFKNLSVDLGRFYIIWATLFIVGFSNAVNITDGLDGLAIGAALTTATVMSIVAYLSGNYLYANYLGIPYVPYAGELTILAFAFIGVGLAFLWFNTFPAKIFMGDIGSLAIGALLAFIALATKSEFILLVAGFLFVWEIVSVIVQIAVCKLTKRVEKTENENGKVVEKTTCKRVFLMAPFHHHLEKMGWSEPQIVVRLWIISIVAGIISLTLLKLR